MVVIAVLAAIFGFFGAQFGLESNPAGVIGALGVVIMYVIFEAKADIKRIASQARQLGKWKDPAFWTALVGAIILPLNEQLGLNLPTEIITGFLALLIPVILKLFRKVVPA